MVLDIRHRKGGGIAGNPYKAISMLHDVYDYAYLNWPAVPRGIKGIAKVELLIKKYAELTGHPLGGTLKIIREPRGLPARRSMFVRIMMGFGLYAKRRPKKLKANPYLRAIQDIVGDPGRFAPAARAKKAAVAKPAGKLRMPVIRWGVAPKKPIKPVEEVEVPNVFFEDDGEII